MNARLRLLALAALALGASACTRITLENYQQLKMGMPYDEVRQLLGPPARCSDLLAARNCTWGSETRYINVSFVADQVVFYVSENLN